MAMTRAEFTTEEAKANGNSWVRLGDGFVAGAGEGGKAGILGVGGIGGGALAEEERGAFCGFDGSGVEAVCAEAGVGIRFWRDFLIQHEWRIARAEARGKMEGWGVRGVHPAVVFARVRKL